MSKNRLYWICQILGWSAWVINDAIFYNYEFGDIGQYWLQITIIDIILCISLTHYFRIYIKKWNWIELPIDLAVVRIVGSVIIMAAIITLINIPLDFKALENVIENKVTFTTILQFLFFWGKPLMFWSVFYYSYHYFERKSEIEVEKVKLETSVKETESKVLRAQMNPHFMFNALNSIRALILEDPEKAQKGVTQLSNILRSSLLADRRKTVLLSEELRTVDDYLALEKIRYEERLQIRKKIDDDTLNQQVPPMLLQTLVENAIKHGVSKPVKGGFVGISTAMNGKDLLIRIDNTGKLETTESDGFGLENTIHRLRLLFGESSTFKLYQSEKDVVTALITIPAPIEKVESPLPKVASVIKKTMSNVNFQ